MEDLIGHKEGLDVRITTYLQGQLPPPEGGSLKE